MSVVDMHHRKAEEERTICILSLLFHVRGQAQYVTHLLADVVKSMDNIIQHEDVDSFARIVAAVTSIHDVLSRISSDSRLMGKMVMAEQREGVLSPSIKYSSFRSDGGRKGNIGTTHGRFRDGVSDSPNSPIIGEGTKTPGSRDISFGDTSTRYLLDNVSTEDDTPCSWIYGKSRYRRPLLTSTSARRLLRVRSYQNMRQVLPSAEHGINTPSSALSGKSIFPQNPLLKRIGSSYSIDTHSLIGLSITPVLDTNRESISKEPVDEETLASPKQMIGFGRNDSVSQEDRALIGISAEEKNIDGKEADASNTNPSWHERLEQANVPPSRILQCLRNHQLLSDTTYTAYLPLWWKTNSHGQYMKNSLSHRKSLSMDTIDTRRIRSTMFSPIRLNDNSQEGTLGDLSNSIQFSMDTTTKTDSTLQGIHSPRHDVEPPRQAAGEAGSEDDTPSSSRYRLPPSVSFADHRWENTSNDLWSSMSVATSELHCAPHTMKYKQMPSKFYSANLLKVAPIREILTGCSHALQGIGDTLTKLFNSDIRSYTEKMTQRVNKSLSSNAPSFLRGLFQTPPENDSPKAGVRLYLMILYPFLWMLSSAVSAMRGSCSIQRGATKSHSLWEDYELGIHLEKLTQYHRDLSMFILFEQSFSDLTEGQTRGVASEEMSQISHIQRWRTSNRSFSELDSKKEGYARCSSDVQPGDDLSEQ